MIWKGVGVSGEEVWNEGLPTLELLMRIIGGGQDAANEAGDPSTCFVLKMVLQGTVSLFLSIPGPGHQVM